MVNEGVIVLVAPFVDSPTSVSASTADSYRKNAEKLGYTVKEYFLPFDWNLLFTKLLPLNDPEIVIYTGHGFPDKWMGDDPVFGSLRSDQTYLLKDRCVLAVPSCLTAKKMGKQSVENGAIYYIGSTDLVWVAFPEKDRNYREDFEFSWFIIINSILRGLSPKEAINSYIKYCNSQEKFYLEKGLDNGDFYSAALRKNRDGITIIGNENYKITPPVQKNRRWSR